MFYVQYDQEKGREMSDELTKSGDEEENFYTLVPEQGLCLIGNDIINLKQIVVIRKLEGKTLIYYAGVADPVILPYGSFDKLREAVFAMDDLDDDDDYEEELEEEG